MAIQRDQLTKALHELLGPTSDAAGDLGANGLQIVGNPAVEHVVTGVSLSLALLNAAVEQQAQAVIVHHGLWFPQGGALLSPVLSERLRLIYRANLSVYGFHGLLDSHPTVGNAAELIRMLGAEQGEPFGFSDGRSWGFTAALPHTPSVEQLSRQLEHLRGSPLPACFLFGPTHAQSIGVSTGSASGFLYEAAEKHLDALIVGDVREGSQEEARELGVNLIGLGHAASERFGPQALARFIGEQLETKATFIDIPNPI